MMYGHEKSDLAIVAVKPTNKAEQPAAEQSAVVNCSGVGGAKGGDQGKCVGPPFVSHLAVNDLFPLVAGIIIRRWRPRA